jgi:rhamnose transport system substrate-binding protein
MQASLALKERSPLLRRISPNGEWVLALALTAELAIFAAIGQNFFTLANFFEVVRLSVELGLLALAMTPIMITGGIDLSVGSLMGLSAVVFGSLWRDAGFPIAAAVCVAVLLGCLAGALNATLITRLNLPPLIVTLGSLSLFRGIAEGITRGAENYSGFPSGFLRLGQGYIGGVPVQLSILVVAVAGYWVLLHRAAIGRTLYAIGFSPSGARYAGIRTGRRIALLYFLSGLVSSIAAIIYVAHLGQAKSDAGTGYELAAITAVVLGGTSVFGGRGTVWGTVLGLFAISVLQNGLRLAALPSELTGVLTGVVLVLTIGLGRLRRRARLADAAEEGVDVMRNSQLAILCTAILAGSLIVAGTNVWLLHSLRPSPGGGMQPVAGMARRPIIAMMPKAKGDPYFISCRAGAEEAAKEAGVDLIWDGPTGLDAAKQNEVVEGWITRGVDAIAVAVENAPGISTVLRKARSKGIKVLTWDADAEIDARDFFINQATPQGIGFTLADEGARLLGNKGEFAIVTGTLSAANQNAWIDNIRKRVAEKYPRLRLATIRPSDDDRDKAFSETQTILKVYPRVKLIVAISAPAVPGAAEAVQQAGRRDVDVIGLSLPNLCKRYVHDGVVQAVVLWNTRDLGYLTVHTAALLVRGQMGNGPLQIGRLGGIEVRGTQVILGNPFIFNKENIDKYDF